MTFVETATALIADADQKRASAAGGEAGREFSLAITALEDAQMRYTRGMAKLLGKYEPADLEKA